jgi:proteic killer suppression protein
MVPTCAGISGGTAHTDHHLRDALHDALFEFPARTPAVLLRILDREIAGRPHPRPKPRARRPTITLDVTTGWRYGRGVIRRFRDPETERLFHRERSRRLPGDIQRVALRKLVMLDAAVVLDDLRIPPGNRLEALKGARHGQHSIRINDQWRICFRWRNGGADDVEIVDYH